MGLGFAHMLHDDASVKLYAPLGTLLCAALSISCADDLGELGSDGLPVVNGTPVIDYPSAGGLLRGATVESSFMQCSGTLIGCDTFLTAAHCVCEDTTTCNDPIPPAELRVFFQHGGIYQAARVDIMPGYNFPSFGDVAVIKLTEPVEGITPTPLASSNPPVTSQMTIVGFGLTMKDQTDSGIKREGVLQRTACNSFDDDLMLCFDFGDSPSVSCSGDSGGPNFIDIGGVLHVAGVVSGGGNSESCTAGQKFATNVSGYTNFVTQVAADSLGGPACGTIPTVADPSTTVVTTEGVGGEDRFTIEVPEGTALLRIGANSMFGSLLVAARFGDAADPIVNDCGGSGRMAAFCEVNSPRAGTWHVLVNSDMPFQGAATAIVGAPIAVTDEYLASSGEVLTVEVGEGLLINDEPATGGQLRAEVVSQPANGVVVIAGDGSFQYQSAEGFIGTDSFTYRAVEDPYSGETEVTVVVEEGGCGCRSSGDQTGGALLLLLFAAFGFRRRRI
jgi:MYXO-CTERM domain-containing protein